MPAPQVQRLQGTAPASASSSPPRELTYGPTPGALRSRGSPRSRSLRNGRVCGREPVGSGVLPVPRARLRLCQSAPAGDAGRTGSLGKRFLRSDGGSYRAASSFLKPLLWQRARSTQARSPARASTTSPLANRTAWRVEGRSRSTSPTAARSSRIELERPEARARRRPRRRERFGSCLARLSTPLLYGGYYPILDTEYVDANGVRFRQESFVARVRRPARPRASCAWSSMCRREAPGEDQVRAGRRRHRHPSRFSKGGRLTGTSWCTKWAGRGRSSSRARSRPSPGSPPTLDDRAYEQARRSVTDYWDNRLSAGATYAVPERRVVKAERNLLIQNLLMTWRYSLGNAYEALSSLRASRTRRCWASTASATPIARSSRSHSSGSPASTPLGGGHAAARSRAVLPALRGPLLRRRGDTRPAAKCGAPRADSLACSP